MKVHLGEGTIKKGSAPHSARPNLHRRSHQGNTNLVWEYQPLMVFSNMIMQRIEIEGGGGNYFNNIWIFKELPNPTLTKDPYHFPARTCCTPAGTLTPTRRFPKAALCGFPGLLVPIASRDIFVSFLPKLSGPLPTQSFPCPKVSGHWAEFPKARPCLPLRSWAYD